MSVTAPIPQEQTNAQLELDRLLESRAFEKSTALRRLLLYLWQHRDEEDLSEYTIAIEALDRRSDFDPRIDSSVRVQVARLRQRLKEYYDHEGAHEPVRLVLPGGAYRIQAEETGISAPAAPPAGNASFPLSPSVGLPGSTHPTVPTHPETKPLWLPAALRWSAIVLGLGAAFLLGWRMSSFRLASNAKPSALSAQAPEFWARLLANGKPLRIVVPNPVFFFWVMKNDESLIVRDPKVNSFSEFSSSSMLQDLEKKYGNPTLGEDYTVATDTSASSRLIGFLQPFGVHMTLSSSSELSPEIADNENLILIGTNNTLAPYRSYLERLSFRLPEHTRSIIDTAPLTNGPREFHTTIESASRAISPGILALIPGRSPGTSVLILGGYHTNALVDYLTSNQGLEDLRKAQKAKGNPEFFEAVVLSDVDAGRPLHNTLAVLKPFNKDR